MLCSKSIMPDSRFGRLRDLQRERERERERERVVGKVLVFNVAYNSSDD